MVAKLKPNESRCPDCGRTLNWRIMKIDRLTQIKYCRDCLDTIVLYSLGFEVERFYMRREGTPPPVIRFGELRFKRIGNDLNYTRMSEREIAEMTRRPFNPFARRTQA